MGTRHAEGRSTRTGWLLARWATVVRGWLVPLVAVVAVAASLLLVAPASAASAAPGDPDERPAAASPTPDPAESRNAMSRARRMLAKLGYDISTLGSPTPDDPNYMKKIIADQVINRVQGWVAEGKTGFGLKDLYPLVQDGEAIYRKSQKRVAALEKKLAKSERELKKLTEIAKDTTRSPEQRAKAAAKLPQKRKDVANNRRSLLDATPTKPDHDGTIKRLRNTLDDLDRDLAKAERRGALPGAKKELTKKRDAVQKALAEAEAEKADYDRRRGDGGDASGTTARGPKEPKGPKKPPTGATRTEPKGPRSVGPKATRPWSSLFRPGGPRVDSGASDLIGQGIADEIRKHGRVEDEKLLHRAMEDPALRRRIIADYREYPERSPWEKTRRDFDGSKGFRQTEALRIGPALIKYEEAENIAKRSRNDRNYLQAHRDCGGYDTCVTDRTRKLRELDTKLKKQADRSNNDAVYRQARVECGGYDTCVVERTRKLRELNTKVKKQADRSNNDPTYQRARQDCGGYDTCVVERTRKLRELDTKLKKQADRSNNDAAYLQARKECGGYDTCVTERTRKLREQNARNTTNAPTAKKTTTGNRTTPKKTTTTKKTDTKKTTTTRANRSNNDPAYRQARVECGGYDTCVTERTRKLREQNARNTTTTPTAKKTTTGNKTTPKKTADTDKDTKKTGGKGTKKTGGK
ncbi:hypothetical protein [Micromonospora sp. NPDC048839]|uniref:hypothetical protein n=1 Tax=Micromonospora sp. NPDC048839 TaxID=3155641 RepID=UPI00340A4F5D